MSENKSKFPSRPKILAVSLAGVLIALPAYAADNPPAEVTESSNIEALTVTGKRSADQKGADDVYYKNVSNAYVGKEYLERYRINAAGDVLKGLNGVYNMNTRTAGGAITPNIRGIAGKGRIPVTVDGTEQTIDVWMNNYGVVDRNYLDPALFRSIAVEKSPALTRGVKSGVGGAVIIRTIEAADIVPEGRKWGFQVATEQSNNAVKPQYDFTRWLGWDDYRTLPIGATADGDNVLGGVGTNTPQTLIFDQGSFEDPRRKNNRFGGDRYWQGAAAFKTDIADGLAAYSYRSKGNYYAGKAGAGGYRNNPIYAYSRCYETGGTDEECLSTATLVPNMAKMFPEGREVYNTNTETKTLLLKNNWHLPGSHKLGWQYMRSDIRFGEINPFQTAYEMTFVENNPSYSQLMRQNQNIDSKVRTDTYKLGWSWKPEGSRWLDLESSFWQIKTDTTRYQSGGAALVAANRDQLFDKWYWCTHRGRPDRLDAASGLSCDDLNGPAAPFFGTLPGFLSKTREEILAINPNDGRKFAVLSNAEQKTRITRTGFDLSNRFRLHPRLNMTLSADYQRERLSEESRITNSEDLLNLRGLLTGMTYLAGPRGGKRREWGTNLVFDWQATDRLKISAGLRYHNFSARDTALAATRSIRPAGKAPTAITTASTLPIGSWRAKKKPPAGTGCRRRGRHIRLRIWPAIRAQTINVGFTMIWKMHIWSVSIIRFTAGLLTAAQMLHSMRLSMGIGPETTAPTPSYTGWCRFSSPSATASSTAAPSTPPTAKSIFPNRCRTRRGGTAASTAICLKWAITLGEARAPTCIGAAPPRGARALPIWLRINTRGTSAGRSRGKSGGTTPKSSAGRSPKPSRPMPGRPLSPSATT